MIKKIAIKLHNLAPVMGVGLGLSSYGLLRDAIKNKSQSKWKRLGKGALGLLAGAGSIGSFMLPSRIIEGQQRAMQGMDKSIEDINAKHTKDKQEIHDEYANSIFGKAITSDQFSEDDAKKIAELQNKVRKGADFGGLYARADALNDAINLAKNTAYNEGSKNFYNIYSNDLKQIAAGLKDKEHDKVLKYSQFLIDKMRKYNDFWSKDR